MAFKVAGFLSLVTFIVLAVMQVSPEMAFLRSLIIFVAVYLSAKIYKFLAIIIRGPVEEEDGHEEQEGEEKAEAEKQENEDIGPLPGESRRADQQRREREQQKQKQAQEQQKAEQEAAEAAAKAEAAAEPSGGDDTPDEDVLEAEELLKQVERQRNMS